MLLFARMSSCFAKVFLIHIDNERYLKEKEEFPVLCEHPVSLIASHYLHCLLTHALLCYPLGELHHGLVSHPGKIFNPFTQRGVKDFSQSSKKCEWFTSAEKLVFSASLFFQLLYKNIKPFFPLYFRQPHNRTQLKIVLRSHHQLPN